MAISKDNYLSLQGGAFHLTSQEDLVRLLETFFTNSQRDKLVMHFHGGLVSASAGMAIAEFLLPVYESAGAYPVFFLWESGLREVLERNLREINTERIFQQILLRVTQFAMAKLEQTDGARAAGRLQLPYDAEVKERLPMAETDGAAPAVAPQPEPLADFDPAALPEDATLHRVEEDQFRQELNRDVSCVMRHKRLPSSLRTPEEVAADLEATRGARVQASRNTLMSPGVLDEIRDGAAEGQTRGLISTAIIVEKAVTALAGVITRFARRRDHGFYTTIIEEILRPLYLDNVGRFIWDQMKADTARTFGDEASKYAGTAFLSALNAHWSGGARPRIILVGHSTGAIYICHFLKNAHVRLPAEMKFDVVFLAPACDFKLLADTIERYGSRIGDMRVFGPRSRRRPLSATQHHPTTSLVGISWHCNEP